MFQLISIMGALFFVIISNAQAAVQMDLQVVINLDKSQLEIQGSTSTPLSLPKEAEHIEQTETAFKYTWPLPENSEPTAWRGGAFRSDENLYLPSGWHPETDELITYNMSIDAPMVVIASGAIMQETQAPNHYSAQFKMDRPIEAIALFAGPYKISEIEHNATKLRTYFYEGMEGLTDAYLQRTAQYIERFETQIGPFPFPSFHIIAAPVPAGYGFAGLTYMGARVLHLPFIKETSLGHEILHNYWGNGVFPDYETGNWAEGLTTYMADYMTAEATSPAKAKEMRLTWLRDYASLPKDQDRSVTTFVSKHGQASQVIGYHKVAFIFHMLRQHLGDDLFFQAIRKLWDQQAFQTASWADLQQIFSDVAGEDLSTFFSQWVTGTGAPEIKSISATADHQKGAGWDINITAVQGSPVFKTYLPLGIGIGDEIIQKTTFLKGRISRKTLSMQNQPHAISVDPDFHLFRKLSPNEAPPILRDVMLSKNVQLFITSSDKGFVAEAKKLASRMIEGSVTLSSQKKMPTQAFILIGTQNDIEKRMKEWRLSDAPFEQNSDASAHIWAGKLGQATPYIIISLSDVSSLSDIQRALPHYGKRSGLIFKGSSAIYKSSGQARAMSTPVH